MADWKFSAYDEELDDVMVRTIDLEEAENKGLIKGKSIGIKEGKTIGIKEGIRRNKIETAENMLKLGIDIQVISQVTGLSLEEVKALKK